MPMTLVVASADEPAATIEYADGKVTVTSEQNIANARLIIAEYTSDGILVSVKEEKIDRITAETPFEKEYTSQYSIKFMLWNSLGEMIPLANAEEFEDSQVTSLGGGGTGGVVFSIQGTGGEAQPQIEYTAVENTDEMRTVAAVDAYLADGETLDGTAEIRIKYDADKGLDATNLLPGYFNPETNEWETIPYMFDEENHEAIIITDHFSKYGLFEVEGSGTPTAFAKPLEATQIAQMKSETAEKILEIFNVENPPKPEDTIGEVLEALDGSFNGKLTGTGSNVSTILTKGGKVETGFRGGVGTQFTIIGIVGACISCANTAYKKGILSADTLKALTKAGISVGVGFATAPVQLAYVGISMAQMAYEHQQKKEIAARHKTIEGIFNMYKKQQGKKSVADWKQEFDKAYKKYYVDELDNTTDNAEEKYQKFYDAVHKVISGYAYQFLSDYGNGDLYDMYLNVPLYTLDTAALAEDLCYNYEIEINESLSSLFLQYSRQAYSDANKKLEAVCEQEREELNKVITLNFYEDGADNIAKNYYVKFYDKKSDDWRANFSDEGKAQLKFTYLSYLQMDIPQAITVFDKGTDKAVGQIPFPNGSLIPGGESEIPFDTDNVMITVNIHEVRQDSNAPYTYANLKGRFVPITNEQDTNYFSFNLDETGSAAFQYSLKTYYDDGAPNKIEILDINSNVVYQTPFDISMSEITLDGGTYSVDISCADEDSIEYYKDRYVQLVYFESFDAKPAEVKSGFIGGDGKLTLMFPKSEYEFRNKDYTLYIYDENGENYENIFDLSQSYGEGVTTARIVLEKKEEPHDDLEILTALVNMGFNATRTVEPEQGTIDYAISENPSLVTVREDGTITSKGTEGETNVYFGDQWGNEFKIHVGVWESGNRKLQGYYCVSTIYESNTGYEQRTDKLGVTHNEPYEVTYEPRTVNKSVEKIYYQSYDYHMALEYANGTGFKWDRDSNCYKYGRYYTVLSDLSYTGDFIVEFKVHTYFDHYYTERHLYECLDYETYEDAVKAVMGEDEE